MTPTISYSSGDEEDSVGDDDALAPAFSFCSSSSFSSAAAASAEAFSKSSSTTSSFRASGASARSVACMNGAMSSTGGTSTGHEIFSRSTRPPLPLTRRKRDSCITR
jgi:hypothetical protein